MATTTVYSSPDRLSSWTKLPNTHLQDDQHYKQLYQQTSQDSIMQQMLAKQQFIPPFVSHKDTNNVIHRALSQIQNLTNAPHSSRRNSSQTLSKTSSDSFDISEQHPRCLTNTNLSMPVVNASTALSTDATLLNTHIRNSDQCTLNASPQRSTLSSHEHIASNTKVNRKNKAHSFRIPKTLKCYTCLQFVRDLHFTEHLFFGTVKCKLCDEKAADCENFRIIFIQKLMGVSSCSHKFEFCFDSFAYISERLSTEECPEDTGGVLLPPNVMMDLSAYIETLSSLETRDPWKHAITICKKLLSSKVTRESEAVESSFHFQGLTTESLTAEVSDNTQLQESCSVTGKVVMITESDETQMPVFSHISENLPSHSEYETRSIHISQSYDSGQLEKMVEHFEMPEDNLPISSLKQKPSASTSRKPKPKHLMKKKASPKMNASDEDDEESPTIKITTEFFKHPDDGRYLILRESIEECPMCYTTLCPSRFSIDVKTFLMTTVCTGCQLPIYIVPESSSGLVIITENETATKKPKSQNRCELKSSKSKPKKHSKSRSTFFAK